MNCPAAHDAISASIDAELTTSEAEDLALHLADCGDCRAWRRQAYDVTRRVRLSAVDGEVVIEPALTATLHAVSTDRLGDRAVALARAGLVLLALAQIALTVPALILGTDHEAPIHVAHEMGAFDLAIAVGFLVAARRPERARGMRMLMATIAIVLAITAAIDVVAHHTTLGDECDHLIAITGAGLIWWLTRRDPSRRMQEMTALATRPRHSATIPAPEPVAVAALDARLPRDDEEHLPWAGHA